MKHSRWDELMNPDSVSNLTPEEIQEGWHWCHEFDGLLVKGDTSEQVCGTACVKGAEELNLEEG